MSKKVKERTNEDMLRDLDTGELGQFLTDLVCGRYPDGFYNEILLGFSPRAAWGLWLRKKAQKEQFGT